MMSFNRNGILHNALLLEPGDMKELSHLKNINSFSEERSCEFA